MMLQTDDYQKFSLLFNKLKHYCDDPKNIMNRAKINSEIFQLCDELVSMDIFTFTINEKETRLNYRENVNPAFIKLWREYEDKWRNALSDIFWSSVFEDNFLDDSRIDTENQDDFPLRWESADNEAKRLANTFLEAMDRAVESVEDLDNEDYKDLIDSASKDYKKLRDRSGLDIQGIYRRRTLIPVVFIPSHVSKSHGLIFGPNQEKNLSVKLQLREAQDAFVFGLPFAAISHMRAIVELILTHHYNLEGNLDEKINKHPSKNIQKKLHAIRMLANAILHSGVGRGDESFYEKQAKDRLENLGRYVAIMLGKDCINTSERYEIIRAEKLLINCLSYIRELIESSPRYK